MGPPDCLIGSRVQRRVLKAIEFSPCSRNGKPSGFWPVICLCWCDHMAGLCPASATLQLEHQPCLDHVESYRNKGGCSFIIIGAEEGTRLNKLVSLLRICNPHGGAVGNLSAHAGVWQPSPHNGPK